MKMRAQIFPGCKLQSRAAKRWRCNGVMSVPSVRVKRPPLPPGRSQQAAGFRRPLAEAGRRPRNNCASATEQWPSRCHGLRQTPLARFRRRRLAADRHSASESRRPPESASSKAAAASVWKLHRSRLRPRLGGAAAAAAAAPAAPAAAASRLLARIVRLPLGRRQLVGRSKTCAGRCRLQSPHVESLRAASREMRLAQAAEALAAARRPKIRRQRRPARTRTARPAPRTSSKPAADRVPERPAPAVGILLAPHGSYRWTPPPSSLPRMRSSPRSMQLGVFECRSRLEVAARAMAWRAAEASRARNLADAQVCSLDGRSSRRPELASACSPSAPALTPPRRRPLTRCSTPAQRRFHC